MKEIESAIEIADSEIFTLSEYLEDTDMKLIHGQRFEKMIGALKILTKLAQKVIDSKDVVSIDEIEELISGTYDVDGGIPNWRIVAKAIHEYINPIITKIQQEKEEIYNEASELRDRLDYKDADHAEELNELGRELDDSKKKVI